LHEPSGLHLLPDPHCTSEVQPTHVHGPLLQMGLVPPQSLFEAH